MTQDNPTPHDKKLAEISFKLMDADKLIDENFESFSDEKKELNVKTPFDAIEKWFKINPKLFKENPLQFKNKVLSLPLINTSYHKQPCET